MRVKCQRNIGFNVFEEFNLPKTSFSENTEFHLTIDQKYIVYGQTLHLGIIWYYLCDDAYTYYPRWNPSSLFSIIDPYLSRYWVFSCQVGKDYSSTYADWNFPEWANNPYYYDALTDGNEKEVNIFKYYKSKMDLEFSDISNPHKAEIVDDQWLYCPLCINGWVSKVENDGMVICENCKNILHNPRYKLSNNYFSCDSNLFKNN